MVNPLHFRNFEPPRLEQSTGVVEKKILDLIARQPGALRRQLDGA